jgi:WD40 repeat protein
MDSIQSGQYGQHKNQVQSIKYSSVMNSLVTCGLDDTVKFIDLNDYKYSGEIKLDSQPQQLDTSNLNGLVVVACINHLVLIKNKTLSNKINLDYETTSVSVSNNLIAVGGKDRQVHIYSMDTLKELVTLTERDFITSIQFSPNGEYLAVADNAKNVKCYKINSENINQPTFNDITKGMWQHHAGKISCISWSPDSNYLATSSVDTHCFIYSPNKISDYIQIKSK